MVAVHILLRHRKRNTKVLLKEAKCKDNSFHFTTVSQKETISFPRDCSKLEISKGPVISKVTTAPPGLSSQVTSDHSVQQTKAQFHLTGYDTKHLKICLTASQELLMLCVIRPSFTELYSSYRATTLGG